MKLIYTKQGFYNLSQCESILFEVSGSQFFVKCSLSNAIITIYERKCKNETEAQNRKTSVQSDFHKFLNSDDQRVFELW